ncbi:MAG: serine hydrolase domain-containing protein [Bacteroidota bacterium]
MPQLIFRHFVLVCLLISFTNCGDDFLEVPETVTPNPENPTTSVTDAFEAYLLEEMEQQNIPALSALVFQDDQIKYQANLGLSDVGDNIPLAADHLFLLASISKTITATALLQLHDQGLFELDDSINDFLPFEVKIPNYTTPITFQMLLTHTSGINDGNALDDQFYDGEDSPVTLRYFLENYFASDGVFYDEEANFYDFEPGTQHEYTNTGNTLMGLLVEVIAQQDFNEYCKEHILAPLNMTNSYWRLVEINQPMVGLYDKNELIEPYTFTDYPNGGLRSTAEDLFKFNQMLMSQGRFNNNQILQAATVGTLLEPQIPTIDPQVGLHFFLMNEDNNLWGHDGGVQGSTTIMAFNPETKAGAIILTNQTDVDLDEILVRAYAVGID